MKASDTVLNGLEMPEMTSPVRDSMLDIEQTG